MSSRRAGSALVLGAFLLMAAGSKQDPNAKKRQAEEDAVARREVGDYVGKLAAVYAKTEAAARTRAPNTRCDGAAMKKAAPEAVQYGTLRIPSVYSGFLRRFGTNDRAAWVPDKTDWAFVTDAPFASHFEAHPDERQAYDVADTAKRIKDTFGRARFMAVIWLEQEASNASAKRGREGRFDGWLFVVDTSNATVMCRTRFMVGWGEDDMGGVRGSSDPDKAIRRSFEAAFGKVVQSQLPGDVRLSTTFGI